MFCCRFLVHLPRTHLWERKEPDCGMRLSPTPGTSHWPLRASRAPPLPQHLQVPLPFLQPPSRCPESCAPALRTALTLLPSTCPNPTHPPVTPPGAPGRLSVQCFARVLSLAPDSAAGQSASGQARLFLRFSSIPIFTQRGSLHSGGGGVVRGLLKGVTELSKPFPGPAAQPAVSGASVGTMGVAARLQPGPAQRGCRCVFPGFLCFTSCIPCFAARFESLQLPPVAVVTAGEAHGAPLVPGHTACGSHQLPALLTSINPELTLRVPLAGQRPRCIQSNVCM